MALTPSNMLPLGTTASKFLLPDVISGRDVSIDDVVGIKGLLVMFICNHCPYVIHINEELVKVANEYIPKNISFIAISSNDIETHPEDGPEEMKEVANRLGYPFLYLFDELQEVAKAYEAQCTPDFFIFDKDLALVYRGQFDNSRPGNGITVSGKDIREALDSILSGNKVNPIQIPSIGCNIKWR